MAPYSERAFDRLKTERRLFQAINIAAAIALAVMFYFISNQNQTIQDQRRESILRACRDQNARHFNTIKTLDKLIAQLPESQRKQAEGSRNFTVLLIDALAPVQNCKKLVNESVHS